MDLFSIWLCLTSKLYNWDILCLNQIQNGSNGKTASKYRVNCCQQRIHTRYMPCIGCVFCILAFVICFILTAIYDRLPDWLIFPPISLLGYHYPEHFVYAILFTCGAICFFISFLYIRKFALKCHGLLFCRQCFTIDILIASDPSGWMLQSFQLLSVLPF